MKPKYIAIIIVVVVVLGGVAAIVLINKPSNNPSTNQNSSSPSTNQGGNQTSGNTVAIQDFAFSPSTLTVKKGTIVTWTNKDSAAHTVTGDDVSTSGLDSTLLNSGDTFQHTFDKTGTFPYHCTRHSSMTATIVVTE